MLVVTVVVKNVMLEVKSSADIIAKTKSAYNADESDEVQRTYLTNEDSKDDSQGSLPRCMIWRGDVVRLYFMRQSVISHS